MLIWLVKDSWLLVFLDGFGVACMEVYDQGAW